MLDPFLECDKGEPLLLGKLRHPKPFLNAKEIEKLQLRDDPARTHMTITGKLNPEDDTIFLKVQSADKDGTLLTFFGDCHSQANIKRFK